MYRPPPGIKRDARRRWHRPERIFFGHGACHILAGVYLSEPPIPGFRAERIVPRNDAPGNHIYVTDGTVAFDHRGYSLRGRLLRYHWRRWSTEHPGWEGDVLEVDFPLLDTDHLNDRKMLGPDQYGCDMTAFFQRLDDGAPDARNALGPNVYGFDPIARARAYLDRIDHRRAYEKALNPADAR